MNLRVKLMTMLFILALAGCGGTQRYECDDRNQEKMAAFTIKCFKESKGGTSIGQCAHAAIVVYCAKVLSN